MSKSFGVAVDRAAAKKSDQPEEDAPLPFHFDDDPDTELHIYKPDEDQFAMVLSFADGMLEGSSTVAAFINLFNDLLASEEDKRYLRKRLLSRKDPFGVTDMLPVLLWAVEESVGRPTQPSSDSSESPAVTGQRSTGRARRTASTRSTSPSTGSSTSSTPGSSNGSKTSKPSTPS